MTGLNSKGQCVVRVLHVDEIEKVRSKAAVRARLGNNADLRILKTAVEGELVGGDVKIFGIHTERRKVRPVVGSRAAIDHGIQAVVQPGAKGVASLGDGEQVSRFLRILCNGN